MQQNAGQQKHHIQFRANPTQKSFIESQARADLFACRMGEGKSAALAWAIWYHTKHNPGAKWAVIRDTWENLRETTQAEFFKWFPPGIFGEYKTSTKKFEWDPASGLTGEVQFLGMDDPADAAKLQSRDLGGIAMDEPAPAAESGGIDELIFDIGISRLRQPGMNWYAVKLAENNPDETHWTYRRFVDPGTPGFQWWQTENPENLGNLPEGYYEKIAETWAHRPDLKRRFLEGKFGFQQIGKAVTPEWDISLHLQSGLEPVPGVELALGWDGGLNPTCVITQVTPLGYWLILEAHVGDNIGMYELIEDVIKPRLAQRYQGFDWRHIGDPTLGNREQSSSMNSAARVITRELGGPFIEGPITEAERLEPLRAVMRKVNGGTGLIQVDKEWAKPVWHALRGGWHYHIDREGNVGNIVKDMHSHPGDATSYLASYLFPLGRLKKKEVTGDVQRARYFGRRSRSGGSLGFESPGAQVPPEAKVLK